MFSLIQLPSLRWIPKALAPNGTPGAAPSQSLRDEVEKCVQQEKVPSSEDIRTVIAELLSQCHIPFYRTPYDRNLHDLCIQECRLKGYPIDKSHGKASILKYLPSGVIIASTGYAHLQSRSSQVFIAIYTAFLTWVDDTYTTNVQGVETFNERFVQGQKQDNEGLDGLDHILREINLHWHGVQANIILTASLNFMTSTILEFETQGMKVSSHAKSYATFLRVMSGISEAYAMFTFPPEVPMSTYIQAIPEFVLYIGYMNDVLSFYKEERADENGNYISNEANLRGKGKLPILRELAHDVSLCVSRVANILEGHQGAEESFQQFRGGYVSFHTSFDSRYHLNDLFPVQ